MPVSEGAYQPRAVELQALNVPCPQKPEWHSTDTLWDGYETNTGDSPSLAASSPSPSKCHFFRPKLLTFDFAWAALNVITTTGYTQLPGKHLCH